MEEFNEVDSYENERIELLGDLIAKTESILCPKPKNVWHIPGAFQRIFSSVQLILSHGCKIDQKGKLQLWSFIFGLRVIRPDLWPNYELKYCEGSITNEQLVSLWLEISLQSHLLPSQLKVLIEDRKRISTYFHSWSFLRCELYADSLLIILKALEYNSQAILATVNPSLMVKIYNKKKKEQVSSFSVPDNILEAANIDSHMELSINIHSQYLEPSYDDDKICGKIEENELFWGKENLALNSKKLSPSFLKVDYSNTPCFGCDKTDNLEKESFHSSESNSETVINEPISLPDDHLDLNSQSPGHVEGRKDMVNLFSNDSEDTSLELMATPLQNSDDENVYVKPSPFLIEYLKSKSKLSLHHSSKSSINNDECVISSKISVEMKKTQNPVVKVSKNFSNSESTLKACALPSTNSFSISHESWSTIPDKSFVSFSKSQTVRSHKRSYSDGKIAKPIIPEKTLSPVSVSFSDRSLNSSHVSGMCNTKKSFMEDGGKSITPEADGFFPLPQPGQTLIDFLTSEHFSKCTTAQLDRENVHFRIAEAVLAALEKMNFENHRKKGTVKKGSCQDESEDDFLNRKEIPTNRRKLRVRSSVPFLNVTSDDEPATTDHSIFDSPEPQSSDSDDEMSTFSETVAAEGGEVDSADSSAAENIAIAILMHYNSKLLPKASELQWLISEQEVPQKLLPLPNSVAVSPDDVEEERVHTLLRGTHDWAPPRPQLILTLHKNTKRKTCLLSQKWRCAGCGLLVSQKLSKCFRLCHYLGKYFCTSCHKNKKAILPAKILHNWDFRKYSVCNFSFELLSRMSCDPLFHLGTLNPKLYRISRDLHQTHIYKLQLFHARIYIITCNRANKERELLNSYPHHWSTEPHVYSLEDLQSVKNGNIINHIKNLTTSLISHISKCKICLGQGFICEICREGCPIFPFQLDAVTQCTKCKECFHFLCFSPDRACPRCQRREQRMSANHSDDR